MTVYVDDMLVPAEVPNGSRVVRGIWSHLIADTPEELHAFAAQLGLRRAWFQEPKGIGGQPLNPASLKAQQWHYDVTKAKREQAIRLGAVPVTRRRMAQIIRERHARLFPEAAAELERRTLESAEKWNRLRADADAHDPGHSPSAPGQHGQPGAGLTAAGEGTLTVQA